jgi:hypothetical protein
MDQIIEEATELKLHPNNMRMEMASPWADHVKTFTS